MKLAAIAGVAGALALIFGAAALVGSALGPDRSARAADRAAPHAEKEMDMDKGHGAETAADPVRGLAVADRGLALQLADTEFDRGRASTLRFRIAGADGRPVRDFAVEHTKRMHVIVVRRDGRGFQHLHPTMDANGTWSVALTLEQAGAYRVFADFKHDERAKTLAADLVVDGSASYEPLPRPATTASTQPVPADEVGRVDGYEVSLDEQPVRAGSEAELRFTVRRGGKVVRTEPYLGAGGHLVALREGDLAYLHVHPGDAQAPGPRHAEGQAPVGDSVSFMTEFPSAGRYRLYLQFKHAGRVHTAEFTQDVAR